MRPPGAKPRTISIRMLVRAARTVEAMIPVPVRRPRRPRTRGECEKGPRPCPWVSCRYHLFLDVNRNGSLRLNFPEREPDELPFSCALDIADSGGMTLDALAVPLNLTRCRVEQIEKLVIARVRELTNGQDLRDDEQDAFDDMAR